MAIKGSASEWVTRWQQGVQGSGPRYVQGVQQSADWAANATSPAAIAARNAGLSRAMNDGSIEAGIARLGTGKWRDVTRAKAANWSAGVNTPQAQANANAGFQRLYGYLQSAEGAISGMPRGGIDENLARFTTWAREIHNQAQAAKGR